jgi:glycosyltransferase involved in cell wall biosynthesis
VGDRPGAELLAAAEQQAGVVATGYVDDLDGEYRRARVALAPLSNAAGLKIKVPQAMAYGLPVVARPPALAGLPGAPATAFGGCSDDPAEFARHLTALLLDHERARTIGAAARAWLQTQGDFREDAAAAVQAYRRAKAAVTA